MLSGHGAAGAAAVETVTERQAAGAPRPEGEVRRYDRESWIVEPVGSAASNRLPDDPSKAMARPEVGCSPLIWGMSA